MPESGSYLLVRSSGSGRGFSGGLATGAWVGVVSSVSCLMSCLTPTGGSASGSDAWLVAPPPPGEEDESRRRLILDLMLTAGVSSSGSSVFLLVWSETTGLCGVFWVFSGSFSGGSGVFSLASGPVGVLRCRERPMDSNLDVRSADSGRPLAQRGAGTGVSVLVGLSRKMADTGLGLEPLG